MISDLLALTQGLADDAAMQNMAAHNQALAASQLNALSQRAQGQLQVDAVGAAAALRDRTDRLRAAGYSVAGGDAEPPARAPQREFAAIVRPSEHEQKLAAADEQLALVRAEGEARRGEIVERVFAPDSPYMGRRA